MKEDFSIHYKEIGEKIKKLRKKKGLSQQQVADKILKFDRAKISDMENGKEDFLFSTLLKVCNALEVDIKSLLNTK
ncbi:helix-turn-helix domain-containing protein [Myroides injenensis]|uniref:helix-turn-helix domain-containing protein n=1 Tax=Myroides injenensis TaxID=1183151 RepID=UPI000289227A|nr:helix-turn-helix transcriptional regulator [Myroides injenensis]